LGKRGPKKRPLQKNGNVVGSFRRLATIGPPPFKKLLQEQRGIEERGDRESKKRDDNQKKFGGGHLGFN